MIPLDHINQINTPKPKLTGIFLYCTQKIFGPNQKDMVFVQNFKKFLNFNQHF